MFKTIINDRYNIHKGYTLTLRPGITVLVGPNGAGKTTLLRQLREAGEKEGAVILSHDNVRDGGNLAMERYLNSGFIQGLAAMASSSEGEGVAYAFGNFLPKVRPAMKKAKDEGKSLLILLDGIDSGASIDRQRDIRHILELISKDCEGNEFFVIISTNCYELTKAGHCIDPRTGEGVYIKSYHEFATYICNYFPKEEKK